jgi:heme-degrading monooxygenase HmoA
MTEPITLINFFSVPAEQAEEFLARWRASAEVMARAEGLRDYTMHRAIDVGATFQFVNVAHWDSVGAHEVAMAKPEFRTTARTLMAGGKVSAIPALYRVIARHPDTTAP